jgi:hypothetical protein
MAEMSAAILKHPPVGTMPTLSAVLTNITFGAIVGAGGAAASMMISGAQVTRAQAMQAGAFMGTMFGVSTFVRQR